MLPMLSGKEGDTQGRAGRDVPGTGDPVLSCSGRAGAVPMGPTVLSQPSQQGAICIPISQTGPQTTSQNNSVVR